MIGIVVVSHSSALAAAALELAAQMVHGSGPRVELAAGTADGGLGTDAVRVAAAIDEVAADAPEGVLVLMDLGSAVLSAELALELRGSDAPVELTSAPLVEGLVAGLVLASTGASLATVAREARGALAAKATQLAEEPDAEPGDGADAASGTSPEASVSAAVLDEGGEGARAAVAPAAASPVLITLVDPAGLHARPAATLVGALAGFDARVSLRNRRTGHTVADASSMSALLTLDGRHGDEIEVTASGAGAAAAVAEVSRLAADGFGERGAAEGSGASGPVPAATVPVWSAVPAASDASDAPNAVDAADGGYAVAPLGVSPGVAVGPVVRMSEPVTEPAAGTALPEAERAPAAASIAAAFAVVRERLEQRAARLTDPRLAEARAVVAATAALAADRALIDDAAALVTAQGRGAERAVWESLGAFAGRLAAQGGTLAGRAADVRDLRARVVAQLRGADEPGLPDRAEPFVLVARELAPADAALLGTTRCAGLITAAGGSTSHTAILARSLGLPAVVTPQALELAAGQLVLLDGTSGEVVIAPSEERVAQASARAAFAPFDGTGATADGHRVELLANVASGPEAQTAAAAHAEGVGLFRTEFVFLDRQTAPSRAEQFAAYRPVLAAFPGRKVVVRTLDSGSDKPLAFLGGAVEPDPALGVRGYRAARRRPEVLDEQLRAIADAARDERAAAWVMAPMISTAAEARDFAAACRAHGLGTAGVMIETPAAALTAAEVLAEVDFVSLGTNDLVQYTMAADRQLAELAALNDPWQPAVLRLIRFVGEAGAAAGKPVGLCGEAAADPALAPVLVGLGVTSLSMTPRALDGVAAALAAVGIEQCRAAGAAAAAASGPGAARAAAAAALGR